MTVTSMSRLPAADAPMASNSGASHDDALVADGFGALVAAHLAILTDTAEQNTADIDVTAGNVDTEPATDSDGLAAGELSDLDETTSAAESAVVVSLVGAPVSMPLLLSVPVPGAGPGGTVVGASPTLRVGESGRTVEGCAGGNTASRAASGTSPTGNPPATLAQVPTADATGDTGLATVVPGGAGTDGAAAEAPRPTAAAVAEPATAAASSYVAVEPAAIEATPLGGPGPASIAGPAVPTGQASAGAVTSQVFPTVPALVSRGEGTHSITLRLHPADLGEVHVTVSVRDGAVQVTLAAGREAQEALRAGSGELRSLLDLAGASGGQLVVRDLPSSPATVPAGTTSGSFQLPAGQASTDGGPGGHDKDTPVSERARADASADDVAVSDTTLRPQARAAAGLDLTL